MKQNKRFTLIAIFIFLLSFTQRGYSTTMNFDFDSDGRHDALTDGLIFLRHKFGLTNNLLTDGTISHDSKLTPAEVEQNINNLLTTHPSIADFDNDGKIDALTDGLIFLRYLFGFRENHLVDKVISPYSNRFNSTDIENYILQQIAISNNETSQAQLSEAELVQSAKKLVETIREFALQSTYENTDELSVIEQLELATSFSNSNDLNALSNALKDASRMFIQANKVNQDALETDGIALNSYNYVGHNENITPIIIKDIGNGYRYEINSPLIGPAPEFTSIDLDLYAELSLEEYSQYTESGWRTEYTCTETEGEQSSFPILRHINRPSPGVFDPNCVDRWPQSMSTTNGDIASFKLTGSITSPYHIADIIDGNIDATVYESLSSRFNGNVNNHSLMRDHNQPEAAPLIYRENQVSDSSWTHYGLGLNIDLNLEIEQINRDNPVTFAGELSLAPKTSAYSLPEYWGIPQNPFSEFNGFGLSAILSTIPIYNRTVSTNNYFSEDLPILELGTIVEHDTDSIEPQELTVFGESYNLEQIILNGEFRQNSNSVKAVFTGSAVHNRSSWGGINQPGELLDLTQLSDNFDTISGGLLESIDTYESTIEELIEISDAFNNGFGDIQDPGVANIENVSVALEFETSPTSDISGINISAGANQTYAMKIDIGSSRLNYVVNDVRGREILDYLGINYEEYLLYLEGFGEDIVSSQYLTGFDFDYEYMPQLKITDNNNTQLRIFESCHMLLIPCDQIGTIKVNNIIAATIAYDDENELYVIQYNDNSFEVF